MASYILRRILVSILILLAASFLMYMLVALSSNPLQDLQGTNNPNAPQLIAARIKLLNLDVAPPLRWLMWLGGAAGCLVPFANSCNLGVTISNAPVADLLPQAMASTVQLVTIALVLAIALGLIVGIATALRQYSGFDTTVTFISFFLFSLPAFLVAVLLKEFLAIGFNNFLEHPVIPVGIALATGVVMGGIWMAIVGGAWPRRWMIFGISGGVTAAVMLAMSLSDWFLTPGLGIAGVALLSAGAGFIVVYLIAGLRTRQAWITAAVNVGLAVVLYYPLQPLFAVSSFGTIVILAVVALVVGAASGWLIGTTDKSQDVRIGIFVAAFSGAFVLIDRYMQAWPQYLIDTGGRPLATVGSSTPGLDGDVWVSGVDTFTHMLLPTVALLLISFAGYTRYARSGMLETLSQDYIRTARAKGLPERVVVVRHAFRNMLIPITTLVAFDIGALLGGAVITETVFGIPGMGQLFQAGLQRGDLNPVMGYFIVIAFMAILFNFLADLAYAALDPRVRVK